MAQGVTFDAVRQAELIVLGNAIQHPSAWHLVADRLSTDDFATKEHASIFGALADLAEDGEPISLPTVLARLGGKVPGPAMGHVVSECYPLYPPRALMAFVRMIRQASRHRRTRQVGADIVAAGPDEAVLADAYERLLRLSSEDEIDTADDEGAYIDAAAETLRNAGQADGSILRTGLADLDLIFPTGIAPRTLTVIAALTSRGKTTLAMQVADRLALQVEVGAKHGTVRICSMEMGRAELHRRRLIAETGIPMECWLGRRPLPVDGPERLMKAVRRLKSRPLRITYAGTMSLGQIRTIARRDSHNGGLSLLVVDYLQLMETGKDEQSRATEVARLAYGLKAIGMDHDVPVLAVAQLNRAAEHNETPKLSDLRESGGIEQAADNVLFVYQRTKDPANVVRLRIGKQRNGPRDLECQALFDGPLFRFENLANEEERRVG